MFGEKRVIGLQSARVRKAKSHWFRTKKNARQRIFVFRFLAVYSHDYRMPSTEPGLFFYTNRAPPPQSFFPPGPSANTSLTAETVPCAILHHSVRLYRNWRRKRFDEIGFLKTYAAAITRVCTICIRRTLLQCIVLLRARAQWGRNRTLEEIKWIKTIRSIVIEVIVIEPVRTTRFTPHYRLRSPVKNNNYAPAHVVNKKAYLYNPTISNT